MTIRIQAVDKDNKSPIPMLAVKRNGFLIDTTNQRGDIFVRDVRCLPLQLSAKKLPFYQADELLPSGAKFLEESRIVELLHKKVLFHFGFYSSLSEKTFL